MPLSRHSVGTYPEMSSHATRQGTLGHSRLSSLSHNGLILACTGGNQLSVMAAGGLRPRQLALISEKNQL